VVPVASPDSAALVAVPTLTQEALQVALLLVSMQYS